MVSSSSSLIIILIYLNHFIHLGHPSSRTNSINEEPETKYRFLWVHPNETVDGKVIYYKHEVFKDDYNRWKSDSIDTVNITIELNSFSFDYEFNKKMREMVQRELNRLTFTGSFTWRSNWIDKNMAHKCFKTMAATDFNVQDHCTESNKIKKESKTNSYIITVDKEGEVPVWQPVVRSTNLYEGHLIPSLYPTNYIIIDVKTGKIRKMVNS